MAIQSNFPNIKPSLLLDFANTKALDPRITFTRSTTATYYDGVTTAKAEENLFQRSQEFEDAYWNEKTNTTVTANSTTAPDGTSTADTITENTATGAHFIRRTQIPFIRNTAFTISVYAKPNGRNQILLGITNVSGSQSDFLIDLVAFTATLNSNSASVTGFSGTATNVGNGWCRATITFTTTNDANGDGGSIVFWLNNSKSYTGDGTSGVFLWGAQLEQRSSVTAYTATTTQAITNYIPVLQTAASGVPRFDHNPITDESLGLLIEEQRTNLIQRSDDFDNAYWQKIDSLISANAIVAPDGSLTGDKLFENSANGLHLLRPLSGITLTTSIAYTYSIFAKAGERSRFLLETNGNFGAVFDLSTASVVTVSAGITASITAVGNGWHRCVVTDASNPSTTGRMRVLLINSGTTTSYTGDGWSGIYIWGAQLEAGAFATSYIPTVASQVTRNADAASMTGTNFSSWYSASEATLYAEGVTAPGIGSTNQMIVSIGDGTSSNQITMLRSTGNALNQQITSAGAFSSQLGAGITAASNTNYKFATCSKVNDFAFLVGSNALATDTSGPVPLNVNKLNIGDWTGGNAYWNGTIRKIAYYPLRVTNAQLQALTS